MLIWAVDNLINQIRGLFGWMCSPRDLGARGLRDLRSEGWMVRLCTEVLISDFSKRLLAFSYCSSSTCTFNNVVKTKTIFCPPGSGPVAPTFRQGTAPHAADNLLAFPFPFSHNQHPLSHKTKAPSSHSPMRRSRIAPPVPFRDRESRDLSATVRKQEQEVTSSLSRHKGLITFRFSRPSPLCWLGHLLVGRLVLGQLKSITNESSW